MKNNKPDLDEIYIISENIIARKLAGEIVIVPIAAGIGDSDEELFSLNPTALAIWEKMDGRRNLKDIVLELSSEFDAPADEIQKDVIGLVFELLNRKIIKKTEGV